MALVVCPDCGKEISDKAERCVHCGCRLAERDEPLVPVEERSVRVCEECHTAIDDADLTLCPKCGCPLPQGKVDRASEGDIGESTPVCADGGSAEAGEGDTLTLGHAPAAEGGPQEGVLAFGGENPSESQPKPDNPSKKKPSKTVIGIVSGIAALVVVLAVVAAVNVVGQNQEKDEFNAYVDDLQLARATMLTGGASAESICGKVTDIWYSAIWDDSRYEWDEDIREYYSTDFNTALAYYYADTQVQAAISTIESNQTSVQEIMSRLSDPPEGAASAYNTMLNLYDEYLDLTGLAISPSGNYSSYSSAFSEADGNFMDEYDKLETQIPAKK